MCTVALDSDPRAVVNTTSPDCTVPPANDVVLADTVNDAGLVAGPTGPVTVTHGGAAATSIVAPVNATSTVCGGGTAPPLTAVNARVPGVAEIAIAGGARTLYS